MTGEAAHTHRLGRRAWFRWDLTRLRIVSANSAALVFWGEASARDLFERMFFPDDATVRAFSDGHASSVRADGPVEAPIALRPRSDAVAVVARMSAATGRMLDIELFGAEDGAHAKEDVASLGFRGAPRAIAVFDRDGVLLDRNDADRRQHSGDGAFISRFDDSALAARALAATLADGGYSQATHTAAGERNRVTMRRVVNPAGEVRIVLETTPSPREGEAGGAVEVETLAQIAHDLRSPLAAAKSAIDFLAVAENLPPQDHATYCFDIAAACEQMMSRLDRLIEIGGAARDGAVGGIELVNLVELVETAVRLQRPRAAAMGATIDFDPGEGGVIALANGGVVANILAALIDNALTHARPPAGLAVAVRLRIDSSDPPAIEVEDNGVGVAAEAIAFLESGEIASTRSDRAGGFGLSGAIEDAASIASRLRFRRVKEGGLSARLVFGAHRGGDDGGGAGVSVAPEA